MTNTDLLHAMGRIDPGLIDGAAEGAGGAAVQRVPCKRL